MTSYSIYEGHMDALREKVAKIERKCKKYGCDFHFAEIGEEFKKVLDEDRNPHICRYILVEVEGTAIISGWEFVSSVEHTEKGNIFDKALTDVEIPEQYRTSAPVCEHCNSNRPRKSTFLVRHTETGEFKQVGKSCLKSFTDGMSADTATFFASLKGIFEEAQAAPVGGCGRFRVYWKTSDILRYAAETVRKFGYIKASDSNSTAQRTKDFYGLHSGARFPLSVEESLKRDIERVSYDPDSDDARELVRAALEWLDEQEADTDYLHNLKTICTLNYIRPKHIGVLASLFPAYNKGYERQVKLAEEQNHSRHIGNIGERIKIKVESACCVSSWQTMYGPAHLYKITDTDGNTFIWKTSSGLPSNTTAMTGTVKEHSEYQGVKQTVLTRCKAQ